MTMTLAPSIGWTEDRIQSLTELWLAGASARAIANHLGYTTRNAVIGKVHRLAKTIDLSKRAKGGRQCMSGQRRRVRPPKPAEAAPPTLEEPFRTETDLIVPIEERRGLVDRHDNQCCWPMGEPRHPGFHYCHHKREFPSDYCAHHKQRMHPHAPQATH